MKFYLLTTDIQLQLVGPFSCLTNALILAQSFALAGHGVTVRTVAV